MEPSHPVRRVELQPYLVSVLQRDLERVHPFVPENTQALGPQPLLDPLEVLDYFAAGPDPADLAGVVERVARTGLPVEPRDVRVTVVLHMALYLLGGGRSVVQGTAGVVVHKDPASICPPAISGKVVATASVGDIIWTRV